LTEPEWKKYLADFNEGLGVVYERFMLNGYFERLMRREWIGSVLEAPLFGMAGVSGINSVCFAEKGCRVTLMDDDAERLEGIRRIWQRLAAPVDLRLAHGFHVLPFEDAKFDLVWNFAALWHVQDVPDLLREMVRVSRKLVFVSMPNRYQVGYLLRKHLLDKDFFDRVDESWVSIRRIKKQLLASGARIVDEGVLDVPPWPDTCMPAGEFLSRLGIRSTRLQKWFSDDAGWQWSTMDYYTGADPSLRERVEKYAWLDKAALPWTVKSVWAHHHYVLARVGR